MLHLAFHLAHTWDVSVPVQKQIKNMTKRFWMTFGKAHRHASSSTLTTYMTLSAFEP